VQKSLEIVEFPSRDAQAYLLGLAGMVLCHLGDRDEGIQLFRRAVEVCPCRSTKLGLATELNREEDMAEGIEICEGLLKANPEDAEVHRVLAVKYGDQDRNDAAKTAALEAVRLAPKSRSARQVLGDVLRHEGDYASALSEYKRARSYFQFQPYLQYRMAQCCFRLGKIARSRRHAKRIPEDVFIRDPYFKDNAESIRTTLGEILTARG